MHVNEREISVEDMWKFACEVGEFRQKMADAGSYLDKLKVIGEYWRQHEANIIEYSRPNPKRWYRTYPINWAFCFTPIEQDAWISIRSKGGIVLYPQYPALNYFLDFGNPLFKIALELDGAQYHKNKARDIERDQRLRAEGWTVFRITGKEMWRRDYKNFGDFSDGLDWYEEGQEAIEDWIMNSGDGVIEAIRCIYFIQPKELSYKMRHFVNLCYKTLNKHCTTEFDYCY